MEALPMQAVIFKEILDQVIVNCLFLESVPSTSSHYSFIEPSHRGHYNNSGQGRKKSQRREKAVTGQFSRNNEMS